MSKNPKGHKNALVELMSEKDISLRLLLRNWHKERISTVRPSIRIIPVFMMSQAKSKMK